MTTELDLRQLAIDRSERPRPRRRRRPIVSRYVAPSVVLFGFVGLLGWAARDRFLPSKPVTVVPVVITRAEVRQAGTPLFQAAGWVEPRPTPVLVSALAEGVIQELFVVAGQEVDAGEPIARLFDADARLAGERSRAELALRQAELSSAAAELQSARQRLMNPVHLDAALAEAESLLARTETELAKVPFLIQAAEAQVEFARKSLEGKQAASSAVAGRLLHQAQSELDRARAELQELHGRRPRLQREVEALRRKRDALHKQRQLLIEESRQVASAEAQVKIAEARLRQASLAVETADLQLARMTVRAPISGRVLALVAKPGTRVMGMAAASTQDATTVVSLYDPQMLQIRADVRLEDVPLVQPGQPVQVETASAKEPIQGVVLQSTSVANIQKNTLEVKVALTSPPPTIRPEMLVAATFLAPEQPESAAENSKQQERLLVPRPLVQAEGESHAVWIADSNGLARRRGIRLGQAGTDDLVEVLEGLSPTDRLIVGGREGLAEGERITITAEDASLGRAATAGI